MKLFLRIMLGFSLIFTVTSWAAGIHGAHSGGWGNVDQSGHGFTIQVLNEETLVIYWLVYSPTGEPTFLLAVADIDGSNASGPVYQYWGMRFGEFDPETVNEEVWGSMSIEFLDCDTAMVSYASDVTHEGHAYGSGTIDLTRLTSIHGLPCYDEILSTTGYWEVAWTELATAETYTGTAISDDSGLVTIEFEEAHLIGTLTLTGPANDTLTLAGRLDTGPMTDARVLGMVGLPTTSGIRFTSATDEFEFFFMPDRPAVSVSQAYLDGEWAWQDSPDTFEMINGEFSWDYFMIDALMHATVQMTIPDHGGNTIPIEFTSVPWPNETLVGHAFYWRDDAAGMEYIELRWVWGDVILSVSTIERPIP